MPTQADYFWDHPLKDKRMRGASNYPRISNISASVSGTTATITWITDIASTSEVAYGMSQYLGLMTPRDNSLVTSHSVTLTGLQQGGLYFFRVQSFRIDSLSISDIGVFLIPAAGITLEDDSGFIQAEDGGNITLEP